MNLPLFTLTIDDIIDSPAEVNFVALVDKPAIQRDFLAFKENFVEPKSGEDENEFMSRCIKYVIDEGKEQEQAIAICASIWDEKFIEDSYNDYPQAATENAKTALRWAEKNGWGSCGTAVGKIRANQLANRESITRDTIARMSAFERHRQNSQKELGDGCGRLMWLAWGGDEGIEWASRKLKQIEKEKMQSSKISFDYDGVLTTKEGVDLLDKKIAEGYDVYIVSARDSEDSLKEFAQKHNINLSNVYATGSNDKKVEKIKELGIVTHYDNNSDVIKELGQIGSKFSFAINEDKRIISGALMLSDYPIYRKNPDGFEYYVTFNKETIYTIVQKFFAKGFQSNVNLMHDDSQQVDGVYMFESWIVDKERGIMPMKGFEDARDGSWFGSFKVNNDEVWSRIKSGEFKGFSVEGFFDVNPVLKKNEEQKMEEIIKILNS